MSDYPPPPPPGQQPWNAPGQPQWSPPGPAAWPAPSLPGGARFAGFWARFGAALLDALILSPFLIIGWIVLTTGEKEIRICRFDATQYCESPTGSTVALFWLIQLAGLVAAILYYGLTEGRTGQTVGKRALGVSVVDSRTGSPIGVGRAIGRYFAKFLSGLPCGLGYLWMLWDRNKQTWHDKMVGSYVVTR